jgi:hypothetical protein
MRFEPGLQPSYQPIEPGLTTASGASMTLVTVGPPRDAKSLLGDAEKILRRELGFNDLKRNDAYRALYVLSAGRDDIPQIDLALGRYEARELAQPGHFPPASTYHRFMTGLTGGKMSSSKPETAVFITDEPDEEREPTLLVDEVAPLADAIRSATRAVAVRLDAERAAAADAFLLLHDDASLAPGAVEATCDELCAIHFSSTPRSRSFCHRSSGSFARQVRTT